MNIKDLPQGSYQPVQPLNINNLPQGSYSPVNHLNGFDVLNAQKKQPNLPALAGQAIGGQIKSGISQIKEGISTIGSGKATPLQGAEAGLGIESGVASILTSPLAPLFQPVSDTINAVGGVIGSIPAVQKFANSPAGEVTSRVATDVANAGNVAGTILGADQVAKTVPKIPEMIGKGIDNIGTSIAKALTPSSKALDSSIVENYTKAVKPTVAGKTGPGQYKEYNQNVVDAVKTITQNKDALSFENDTGTVTGELPQTRSEFADAIDQTKRTIFAKYDALAKQATGQGVQVPLDKAGTALDEVINNEALKITNPSAIKYAEAVKSRIQNPDGSFRTVTPEVAQEAITSLNSALKAFYRNPTYDSASQAAIDAGVVHQLRIALDEQINNATGADYSALKQQYGALSAIEKDVAKAAIAQAKQTGTNVSGLGKYIDVFSGGDIVSGLLSLNPALFAKGIAQGGISRFFQWLNSPDRAVQNIFKTSAKTTESVPKGEGVTPKSTIPPELAPLAKEAQKYKSAEDFVKAQTPMYHGSAEPLQSFHNESGVFFTDNYFDATGFAGNPLNIYEGYLNFKKPLIIDAKGAKWDELNTKYGKTTREVVGNAEKAGFDGVTFKNIVDNIGDTADYGGESTISYAFKPKDQFLNESQLTDFYNKVTKGKK